MEDMDDTPSRKRGPKRPRSVVWYYFDKLVDDPHKAKCKLCGATCSHANNTSNLFCHLRAKHPSAYQEAQDQREAEMAPYYAITGKQPRPTRGPDPDYVPESSSTPRKRPGRPRSIVWDYFDKIQNEPDAARCRICGAVCHHANNTSNLLSHMRLKHASIFREAEERRDAQRSPDPELRAEVQRAKRDRLESSLAMSDASEGSSFKGNKIPRRPRSVVWYYFEKLETDRAKCKICGAICHHANNTSNLFNHLRINHPDTFKEAEEQRETEMELYYELKAKSGKPIRTGMRGRPRKSAYVEGSKAITKTEDSAGRTSDYSSTPVSIKRLAFGGDIIKQAMTKSLLKIIAVDHQAPSFVHGKGFREFHSNIGARFEIPSKKSIMKTLVPQLAEETKRKIKLDVVIASYFALTVETWVYKESETFMTLSAHFIKDSWEMSSVVLETFDCTEEKTETNIATSFKTITDEWGITDRVIALVANNTEDVIPSATLINGWDQLLCFGHTMNLVITNAFMSVPELVEIQRKATEAGAYFDKNMKAYEALTNIQQQHSLPVHKLKQVNPRFWTSTYAMFERMVEQFEAVNTVLCLVGKDHMCLCDDEVELIKSVVEVLKPFEAATKELCTEQYTYMSKVIPIAALLQQVASVGIGTLPGPQSDLKNALITQMQQMFANVEHDYKLAAATLLDPRFKHHAFTDSSALETAQQRLLSETAGIVQNIDGNGGGNGSMSSGDAGSTASFWNMFDSKVSEAGAMKTPNSEAENETRRYFKEANIPRNANPLSWWKLNEVQYPHLKSLAQKYLCIPATASSSSHLFTKEGDLVALWRNQIRPGDISTMVFLSKNLN